MFAIIDCNLLSMFCNHCLQSFWQSAIIVLQSLFLQSLFLQSASIVFAIMFAIILVQSEATEATEATGRKRGRNPEIQNQKQSKLPKLPKLPGANGAEIRKYRSNTLRKK
jgi:hypothetical protein